MPASDGRLVADLDSVMRSMNEYAAKSRPSRGECGSACGRAPPAMPHEPGEARGAGSATHGLGGQLGLPGQLLAKRSSAYFRLNDLRLSLAASSRALLGARDAFAHALRRSVLVGGARGVGAVLGACGNRVAAEGARVGSVRPDARGLTLSADGVGDGEVAMATGPIALRGYESSVARFDRTSGTGTSL